MHPRKPLLIFLVGRRVSPCNSWGRTSSYCGALGLAEGSGLKVR